MPKGIPLKPKVKLATSAPPPVATKPIAEAVIKEAVVEAVKEVATFNVGRTTSVSAWGIPGREDDFINFSGSFYMTSDPAEIEWLHIVSSQSGSGIREVK